MTNRYVILLLAMVVLCLSAVLIVMGLVLSTEDLQPVRLIGLYLLVCGGCANFCSLLLVSKFVKKEF